MKLRRFWIKFALTFHDPHPIGVLLGCGITAYDLDDALQLARTDIFECDGFALPQVEYVIEDVDVRDLDKGHVRPNMGVVVWRGVWYPRR